MNDLTHRDRVLLHLYYYQGSGDDYARPFECTQEGIGKAVNITKANVSNTVNLNPEYFVRRHVSVGKRGRRFAYQLTEVGVVAASSLMRHIGLDRLQIPDAARRPADAGIKSLKDTIDDFHVRIHNTENELAEMKNRLSHLEKHLGVTA